MDTFRRNIKRQTPRSGTLPRWLWLIFLLVLAHHASSAQSKWTYAFGFGINYSKLFLEPPDVPYIDTYHGLVGLQMEHKLIYAPSPSYSFSITPGLSILGSRDNADIKTSTVYASFPLKVALPFSKRFSLSAGLAYQYLLGMSLTLRKNTVTFTGFAKNRHFWSPTMGATFHFNKYLGIELSALYATRNLFNAGAADLNGNIIGPLKTYNHSAQASIWYTIDNQHFKRRKNSRKN